MKRIAATPLWFLLGWYVGSVAALALGVGPLLAPIMAVAFAGLVIADPLRIIWSSSTADQAKPSTRTIARADDPID